MKNQLSLAALALALAGLSACGEKAAPQTSAQAAPLSAAPSVFASATPPVVAATSTASPAEVITAPLPAPLNTRPASDFANATFEVSAFPSSWSAACPSGVRTFKDGYSLIKPRPEGDESSATGISLGSRLPVVVG